MDDLESLAIVLIVIFMYLQTTTTRNPRKRRYWERPHLGPENRRKYSQMVLLDDWLVKGDSELFFKYLRFSMTEFKKLERLIGPSLTHHCFHRETINPSTRLAITLRFLATGESQRSLALNYRLGDSTVSNILKESLVAIPSILKRIVMPECETEMMKEIAEGFWKRWNFPHCCGCLDGKHVRIKKPIDAGSEFRNYLGYDSVVLLAICDHKYRFIIADIGSEGRNSDGGIFKDSTIGKRLRMKRFPFPNSDFVKNGPFPPYFFLADSAFALTDYMMTPYARPTNNVLPLHKQIYNYRQSRARRVIENAFGILVSIFRIFKTEIDLELTNIDNLILSAICLHNYRLMENERENVSLPAGLVDKEVNGSIVEGSWRKANDNLDQIGVQQGRHSTMSSADIRHELTSFLVSKDGEVPWQYNLIDK